MHYGFDEQQGLPEMDDCKLFLLKFDTLIYENKLRSLWATSPERGSKVAICSE